MSAGTLVFYDTSSVYYSGYYLKGFYDQAAGHYPRLRISNRLPAPLISAVRNTGWQHLLFSTALFGWRRGSRERFFCIDSHDSNSLNMPGRPDGYHLPLLEAVDAWFKVNYNPAMIEATPELREHRKKIGGVAQFFPLQPPMRLSLARRLLLPPTLFGYRPGLAHDQPWSGLLDHARRRLQELRNFDTLPQILTSRRTDRDIDIFFVTSFYSHPRHAAVMEQRHRIMQRLRAETGLTIATGFTSFGPLPEKFADTRHRRLGRREYLDMLSRSRVLIYTRGMEDCISSRFSLAMALGVAVAGERLANNPELLGQNRHLSEQFAWEDAEEIADHAIALARYRDRAAELGARNLDLFDTQLAPRVAARRILEILATVS